MSTKKTLAQLNAEIKAKAKAKRNGLKVSAETMGTIKKTLKAAALLNKEVTGRAKIEKLVSK